MIKLIVCDLDETLLNSEKKISDHNLEAIKKAHLKGVKFVPATGRGYSYIDDILKALDIYDKENEYIISNNGAIITENKNFKELTFHKLPFSIAKQIIELGMKLNLCVQVFTARDVYAFNINEDEKKWLFMFKKDAVLCDNNDFRFLENRDIVKVMFQYADMQYLFSLTQQLNEEIRSHTTIAFSSNRYMEFTSAGISKGNALKELVKILDISLEETLAIGDNHNDLSMLETAGIATAVGNAVTDVKEKCDYVSPFTNDEDAVADIIEKNILNV